MTVEQQEKALTRILAKAQAEKKAKANGLWDYRNGKIVGA